MKVIYHKNCADGFCCAWLMHKAFPEAEFLAASYGDAPPDVTGERVYLVDFSYKRPVMHELIQKAEYLTVLDHHETAEFELRGLEALPNCSIVFDMNKSGARLTAENLLAHGLKMFDYTNHDLVNYTEDYDLWRFRLWKSQEVSAAIRSYPFEFRLWDEFQIGGLAFEGEAILRYQNQLVEETCKHATFAFFDGVRVPVLNSTCLWSQIGNELAKGQPFSAIYHIQPDGRVKWSLRSVPDGMNVAEIAARRGGGGHKHAAGFLADRDSIPNHETMMHNLVVEFRYSTGNETLLIEALRGDAIEIDTEIEGLLVVNYETIERAKNAHRQALGIDFVIAAKVDGGPRGD